ncbi:heat shock protein DnaJ-like protein [Cylindrospermum sp. NIES-4074]|nr:heat shock protein DnaJ-like protein [Cylindrospermum sp. NIES-4074]
MPRKTSAPSPATPLALSELHIQLEGLEKEHQSLLKQIKKKRTELKNFVEKMRSLATEVFHRATPSFQKMADLDQEIHTLFAEILTTKKLGKQTKKSIEVIYHNLQLAGVISYKPDSEDEDIELDELFENSEQENTEHRYQDGESQQELPSPSTARTEESRKIRQTFLRLAEIFHPDKVKDSETQMHHTEIMKEINTAYQEGDLARLLEIERQHQVGEAIDRNSEDDLTRKCRNLEQQNEILKTQYENLKRELRLAKNTPEGAMVADTRKAAKQGIDAISQMLETIESQTNIIAEIRDYVKDFKEQKITIKEFLQGPTSLQSLKQKKMEEMLDEMLEELGRIMDF